MFLHKSNPNKSEYQTSHSLTPLICSTHVSASLLKELCGWELVGDTRACCPVLTVSVRRLPFLLMLCKPRLQHSNYSWKRRSAKFSQSQRKPLLGPSHGRSLLHDCKTSNFAILCPTWMTEPKKGMFLLVLVSSSTSASSSRLPEMALLTSGPASCSVLSPACTANMWSGEAESGHSADWRLLALCIIDGAGLLLRRGITSYFWRHTLYLHFYSNHLQPTLTTSKSKIVWALRRSRDPDNDIIYDLRHHIYATRHPSFFI